MTTPKLRILWRASAFFVVLVVVAQDASAWGPRARKAIAMTSLQIIRSQYNDAFKGGTSNYEIDLLRGAEDGYAILGDSVPLFDDSQAIAAVFHEIQLLRAARDEGTGSYFAYRMGVLSALASSVMIPFGIPYNESAKATTEELAEDLDGFVSRFTFTPQRGGLVYIRSADTYYAERRLFYDSDTKLIHDDYRGGRGGRGFIREASQTYFDRSVRATTDCWYSVFRNRGESTDIELSRSIVSEYFANSVEYLLTTKKNMREAERTYLVFKRINPVGNEEIFERMGDLFYAFGTELDSEEARERGVKEWQIAYGHPGPQRRRASAKLATHYIKEGEDFYRASQSGGDARTALQAGLQAFESALKFERTNDVAAQRITETTVAIKELDERYALQTSVIDNALSGIREAERSALEENYANALTTYNQVENGLALVDTTFEDLDDIAKQTRNELDKARRKIFEDVLDRAERFVDDGDRAIDERRFDDAVGSYQMVDTVLTSIPAAEGSSMADRKSKIMERAELKVAEANDAKQRYQQSQSTSPVLTPKQN